MYYLVATLICKVYKAMFQGMIVKIKFSLPSVNLQYNAIFS